MSPLPLRHLAHWVNLFQFMPPFIVTLAVLFSLCARAAARLIAWRHPRP